MIAPSETTHRLGRRDASRAQGEAGKAALEPNLPCRRRHGGKRAAGAGTPQTARLPFCFAVMIFSLAQVSLQQRDPVKNFCRQFGHQTTVVDRKLYIDGGFVNWSPLAQNPENASNSWLLYQDLDRSSSSGMPQLYVSLSKNASIPQLNGGVLWPDEVNKRFYQYGGAFNKPGDVDAFELFSYDIINNKWDSFGASRTGVVRLAYGAGVGISKIGKGFYYGGWMSNATVPGWGARPAVATSFMLKYDYDTNTWSNNTGPDAVRRAGGAMAFIPAGDGGLLVYLGGVVDRNGDGSPVEGQPLSQIFIYDIANSKWYTQTALGAIPANRRRFCIGASWPADRSSYNIYLYGGMGFPPSTAGFDDVYVLSMPGFSWVKLAPLDVPSTGKYPHHSMTCNVVPPDAAAAKGAGAAAGGSQMLVIGGTFPLGQECDAPEQRGTHNMDLGAPGGNPWQLYQPTHAPYTVPARVASAVGGAGAFAAKSPLGGWNTADLGRAITRTAPALSAATRTPTRSLPPSGGGGARPTGTGTTPDQPSETPQGEGTSAIAGIAAGAVVGAVALVSLGIAVFFWFQRRRDAARERRARERPSSGANPQPASSSYGGPKSLTATARAGGGGGVGGGGGGDVGGGDGGGDGAGGMQTLEKANSGGWQPAVSQKQQETFGMGSPFTSPVRRPPPGATGYFDQGIAGDQRSVSPFSHSPAAAYPTALSNRLEANAAGLGARQMPMDMMAAGEPRTLSGMGLPEVVVSSPDARKHKVLTLRQPPVRRGPPQAAPGPQQQEQQEEQEEEIQQQLHQQIHQQLQPQYGEQGSMASMAAVGASETGELFIANDLGSEELAAPQPIKPIVFNPPHGWNPRISVLEGPEATQAIDEPSPEQEANDTYYSRRYGDDGTYPHEQQQQKQYGQEGVYGYGDDGTYAYEQEQQEERQYEQGGRDGYEDDGTYKYEQQQQQQQYGEDGIDQFEGYAENDMYSGEQRTADGTNPDYGYDQDGAGRLHGYGEEQLIRYEGDQPQGYEGDDAYPPEQYGHDSAYPHEHDGDETDAYRSHEDISPPLEEYVENGDYDRYEEEQDELDSTFAHDETEVEPEEDKQEQEEHIDDDDDDGDSRVHSGLDLGRVGDNDWATAGHGHCSPDHDGPRAWPQTPSPELSPEEDDDNDDAAYRRSPGLPEQMADAADRVREEDDDSPLDRGGGGGDRDSESRYSSVTGESESVGICEIAYHKL